MTKIRDLTRFQKILLLLCAAMTAVFTVLTAVTTARVGLLYKDTILVPRTEGSVTLYEGKISGEKALFTVAADRTIIYRRGERSYGPYTLREDPTAIPEEMKDFGREMTGVEIRRGEEIYFRGGSHWLAEERWLFHEDGTPAIFTVIDDGAHYFGASGREVDPHEPSPSVLVELWEGPELTHKGSWGLWAVGLLTTVAVALFILFADKLMRWDLSFMVREPEKAEPSDWLVLRRNLGWIFLLIGAFLAYCYGLQ